MSNITLAQEIANSLTLAAHVATSTRGDQTKLLEHALKLAAFDVSEDPDNAKKLIGIIRDGATHYDDARGAWVLADDTALSGAVDILIDGRDNQPELLADDTPNPAHLSGEEFTEAKRTLNKVLSNITTKKWATTKVACKGSKTKGYYFEAVQDSDDSTGESGNEEESELVELTIETFDAEIFQLVDKHIDAGVDGESIILSLRKYANMMAKMEREAAKAA